MTIPPFRHATPASRTFCGPDTLTALPGQLDRLGEALLTHALRMLSRWLPRLGTAPDDPEPRIRLILAAPGPQGTCGDGSAIARVERLLRASGVPARPRDAGVARDSLSQIAAHTLDDWTLTRVPRPAGRQDLEELLHAAW
jgi:alcohol dehydrogenase class IV